MAITLIMMAAVVTLFANISNSVRNRRAVVELSGQIRHVRNVLQRDLQAPPARASPGSDPKTTGATSKSSKGSIAMPTPAC